MAIPQIGLIGSEQALRGGLEGALGGLEGGLQNAQFALGSTLGRAGEILNQGSQGIDVLAGQAGLRGPQAQQQAFSGFQASPGQQFIQNQAQQALLRNASALGGIGGGNVRRELVRQGAGFAAQDFGNQFNRGVQALQLQQAPASQLASLTTGAGQGVAQAQLGTAGQAAQAALGTGGLLSQGRLQTGQDIAQQTASTTSALSNLLNQQGGGLADIIGGGATNVANLLQGFGGAQGVSQEQLAQLLGNLAVQQGTTAAAAPSPAALLNNQGIVAQLAALAEGAGTAAQASDRRLKKNIKKLGELPNGLNIYSWDWRPIADMVSGVKMTMGVMADEVMQVMPKAVILDKSGYLKVNYGMVLNG